MSKFYFFILTLFLLSLTDNSLAGTPVGGGRVQTVYAVDYVDLIEINHYFDSNGSWVYDQLIFYEWDGQAQRFQVRSWRMLKSPCQLPYKNFRTGRYVTTWQDGEILRRVYALSLSETHTTVDPEREERRYLAEAARRKLKIR
ncbi:MAG: hypothetical protein MPJ24_01905 [Pirellulaceae bacterium]|nr:hypothetical protein [Pirellulaceae bacterium]